MKSMMSGYFDELNLSLIDNTMQYDKLKRASRQSIGKLSKRNSKIMEKDLEIIWLKQSIVEKDAQIETLKQHAQRLNDEKNELIEKLSCKQMINAENVHELKHSLIEMTEENERLRESLRMNMN